MRQNVFKNSSVAEEWTVQFRKGCVKTAPSYPFHFTDQESAVWIFFSCQWLHRHFMLKYEQEGEKIIILVLLWTFLVQLLDQPQLGRVSNTATLRPRWLPPSFQGSTGIFRSYWELAWIGGNSRSPWPGSASTVPVPQVASLLGVLIPSSLPDAAWHWSLGTDADLSLCFSTHEHLPIGRWVQFTLWMCSSN